MVNTVDHITIFPGYLCHHRLSRVICNMDYETIFQLDLLSTWTPIQYFSLICYQHGLRYNISAWFVINMDSDTLFQLDLLSTWTPIQYFSLICYQHGLRYNISAWFVINIDPIQYFSLICYQHRLRYDISAWFVINIDSNSIFQLDLSSTWTRHAKNVEIEFSSLFFADRNFEIKSFYL